MQPRHHIEALEQYVGVVPEDRTTWALLSWFNVIPTPGAVLFRRTVLQKVGKWEQNIAPLEDYDIFLRCAAQGDFVFLPQPSISYRKHSDSGSNNTRRVSQATQRLWHKTLRSHTSTPEQRRIIQNCYFNHQQVLCQRYALNFLHNLGSMPLNHSLKEVLYCLKKATIYYLRYTP